MFCTDTLNYFLTKDAKFARFYLLPKIYKRPGRPAIQIIGIILRIFLHFWISLCSQLPKKVKSYIKDTNDLLKKLHSLTHLPGNSLLCTMDVVDLYHNILHDEGLSAVRKRLNERNKKDLSTDTLVKLAELVLKNNIFNFSEITLKQKRGTAIGRKFALPYSIYGRVGGKHF